MSDNPSVSIIVLTRNEGEHLRRTVQALEATMPESAEIVVVDDGSEDRSTEFLNGTHPHVRLVRGGQLGVAKGRNFGARHARGDVLLFADAHVDPPADWWPPFAEALQDKSAGAVGSGLTDMTDRGRRGYGMRFTNASLNAEWLYPETLDIFNVPLLPGCFWAMWRTTFEQVGGLDGGMSQWGSEDFELSLRLCLFGYELHVVPEVEVAHLFRSGGAYHVDEAWVVHNQLRMAYLHFNDERFERVRSALSESEGFERGWQLLQQSTARERRNELRSRRTRDDDWYFQSFGGFQATQMQHKAL
jgi:GT2 family glycosyltransferase